MTQEKVSDNANAAANPVSDNTAADPPADEEPLRTFEALPLLKFEGPNEKPMMYEEALNELARLPGPVRPIAFVGDGRSGKSYLASKIAGEGTFKVDDTDVAVTNGIDVAIVPCHPGHLILFDCEGGNNAMSKSHSVVTVVGALLATSLIFVTDGKASEAAVEALAKMLQERSLIKCDGTGSLHAQSLLFVVNQNRLRYDEDALEKILALKKDAESTHLRGLINESYPEGRRFFYTLPNDCKKDFDEKWNKLNEQIIDSARPLKMGKLWMTGKQVVEMLKNIGSMMAKHGKVSLPSLHRHVILDSWLKPTVSQVIATGLTHLIENSSKEELAKHKVGYVKNTCEQCKMQDAEGWEDPDTDEHFCMDCWREFSPKVLKCSFCSSFQPWSYGRVEQVTKQWHCIDCLMQLGIDID